MKNILLIFFLTLNYNFNGYALDLKTLFEEAKVHNNTLKDTILNRDILEQNKNQLKSAILPSLSLNASFIQFNQARDFTTRGLDDTPEVITIRGVQRIFSGLKEIYTLQSVNALITAEEYKIKSQQLDLLSELSRVYFQIYLQQEKMINIEELVTLSLEREELLKKRVKIGNSRNTELSQARVQSNLQKIALQETQLQLSNLWNDLNVIVGKTITPQKLNPYLEAPYKIESLQYYLQQIMSHPLVLAQEANILALSKEKNSWQSDYFPTINLTSNYYAQAAQNWAANPEWDFGISIAYPFFEGGITRARVAESALKVAKSSTQLTQLKVALENQVNSVYQTLLMRQQQQKTIEQISLDNKKNYNEIRKEYSMGLVTNLEVVTALNIYTESLNQKVENSINLQFNFILLKALTGEQI